MRSVHSFWNRKYKGCVPGNHRVYAVGDIHGRVDLLNHLMKMIFRDSVTGSPLQSLVFIGDYVDRGPDSKEVINRLLEPLAEFQTYFLRGNHDQALLDFLADARAFARWKPLGGEA